VLLQFAGLFLTLLGLPGLWLMVGTVGAFAWLTQWDRYIGWPAMVTVLVLAILAEIVEFVAGAAGSAKAGGSKRGMAGAIVGGVVGGIALSILLPIPVIGTLVGVCLGSFAGAFVVEVGIGKEVEHSMRVGIGAAKGRFWGTIWKLAFGVLILITAMVAALPL
jgi:uncharacterized protein YqgC (DUF456 family)